MMKLRRTKKTVPFLGHPVYGTLNAASQAWPFPTSLREQTLLKFSLRLDDRHYRTYRPCRPALSICS